MSDILEVNTKNTNTKPRLLIVTGPTAVGKTALSLKLAKALDGEILSADSMQVYRGMDIGTAKISPAETEGVPHHLLSILSPDEPFDVNIFQRLAKEALADICGRGRLPVVVGGTGFYIQALLRDVHFTEKAADIPYREALLRMAKEGDGAQGSKKNADTPVPEEGLALLHDMLRQVDPASAEAIPKENVKRVIRALEYHHTTGEPISSHNRRERERVSPYDFLCFVLTDDRERLYRRIDARVDRMLSGGLLEEVRGLKQSFWQGAPAASFTAAQGIGYKQLLMYLDGEISYEEAVERIKRDSRHFAKRQLTWFRREKDVLWLSREDYPSQEELLAEALRVIHECWFEK